MNALEYNDVILAQQRDKITGLQASLEDLEKQCLRYRGALTDAQNDLERFKEHRQALESNKSIPPLALQE